MAKVRDEIVGKRFLSVSSESKLDLTNISKWDWRAGFIRACSHVNPKHPDLQVLVEYDDVTWQRREWLQIFRPGTFNVFLIEHTLAWANRSLDTLQCRQADAEENLQEVIERLKASLPARTSTVLWPVLVFSSLVDEAGLEENKFKPVEYLLDSFIDFQEYSHLQYYQDGEEATGSVNCPVELLGAVREWVEEQNGQRILLTTPSVLVGYRVQVYRTEGTTQWYTAVIGGYNDSTRELTVTSDTVLEEHSENPSLVQIKLIGEGVVESILRGENGITPRRSRNSSHTHYPVVGRHVRRDFPSATPTPTSQTIRTRKSSARASPSSSVSPHNGSSPPLLSPTSPKVVGSPDEASFLGFDNKAAAGKSHEGKSNNEVKSESEPATAKDSSSPPSVPSSKPISKSVPKTSNEINIDCVTDGAKVSPSDPGRVEVVGGRGAVTITATSGPAPQGATRVASPPSVSITAVVKSDEPAGTRMDHDGSSDSGVSVTERSISRSSVLSDSDVVTPTVKGNPAALLERKEPARVWRDPSLVTQSDLRHIHSLQHAAGMSQHFSGLPQHPSAAAAVTQPAPPHPSQTHPSVSLPHGIPPGLAYPGAPLLMPPLTSPFTAAGIYQQDMWKQLGGHVPSLAHSYASHLSAQEELLQLERVRGMDRERIEREQRRLREQQEAELRERERLAKEKMERERAEKERRERRERREREEREKRDMEEKKHMEEQVKQHFENSLRYAPQQKFGREALPMADSSLPCNFYGRGTPMGHSPQVLLTHPLKNKTYETNLQGIATWNPKPLGIIDTREDERHMYDRRMEERRPQDQVGHNMYKVTWEEKARESQARGHIAPTPAHSGLPNAGDKVTISSVPKTSESLYYINSCPVGYVKESKSSLHADRPHFPHPEKASVIVTPDLKNEKISSLHPSPKQRSSPYQPTVAPFKTYELSPSPQSRTHYPVELTKPRPAHSSSGAIHSERYYHQPPTKPPMPAQSLAGVSIASAHITTVPSKTKTNSNSSQIYGKPHIASGASNYRIDSRTSQPLPLSTKPHLNVPPPAHSSNKAHENRNMPIPLDQRPCIDNRISVDALIHSAVKSVHSVPPQNSTPQSTQIQPLDLGTREDAASPLKRQSHTPTAQEIKKPKIETPILARVSEPSPLFPAAATTITTVENVAAMGNLSRVESPIVIYPTSQPHQVFSQARSENSQSPVPVKVEPSMSSSPGPVGGYVHKLKKAWLNRHEGKAENLSSSNSSSPTGSQSSLPNRSPPPTTPPSGNTTPTNVLKIETVNCKSNSSVSVVNGHGKAIIGESSSSDSEGSSRRSGKSQRISRGCRRGMSESESDKESDGSETSTKRGRPASVKQDEPKKRGRKPKVKADEEMTKSKKMKEDSLLLDTLQKPPISQLKKTGESFLQDGPCYELSSKLPKCRECRWTPHQRSKKKPNIFCRFYAFRRLRYTKNGVLTVAGFSHPVDDSNKEDLKLWMANAKEPAPDLDIEMSKFLLTYVGDQFCNLVQQEKYAKELHMGDSTVAWKRAVQGVREMCDVCETTLFNIHWACSKCGFVVCIDCYKGRRNGTIKIWDEGGKERDEYQWLLCASKLPHEQDKLMLTQIISGNALYDLCKKVHEVRHSWNIPQYCDCLEVKKLKEEEAKRPNGLSKDLIQNIKSESKNDFVNGALKGDKGCSKDSSDSPLNFFADVALSSDKRDSETSDSDSDSDDKDSARPSTLRELLVRPTSQTANGNVEKEEKSTKSGREVKKKGKMETLEEVISSVLVATVDKEVKNDMKVELKHFIRKYHYGHNGREPIPIRIMTNAESALLYPDSAHSWLCDGKLLRLLDPMAESNVTVFQDQWKRGQPVIVSGVGQRLSSELWTPYSFSRDYGDIKNDLINCLTNNIVPNQSMRRFWDGFDAISKRLRDDKGQPMLLKLKDWPPGEDFAEMLPSRFEDLMRNLPMGEYTRRNGRLNLAGRLPEFFVRPDLGPKMYIAYGSASHPSKASTNLHLDVSDAANVMCYVSVNKDGDYESNAKEALKAVDDGGCDILTRKRIREKDEVPGALWHIYHARDSDKIRDFLNKVAIERGDKLEPHHDPIHDQSWYLDGLLRERLYKEYNVEGYAIVQCMGDAVFVPAGTPHQVRNLHNCIKVAEDFVSPENISHCFHLTQEFRHLSDTHTNHEDKLQIKNIIYHTIKDALSVLLAAEESSEKKSDCSKDEKSP